MQHEARALPAGWQDAATEGSSVADFDWPEVADSLAMLYHGVDGVMQLMMLGALLLIGRSMNFGRWYQAGVVATAALFLWQQWLIRKREPAGCLRAFLNNQYVGLVVFVGILLQYVYA